jgi:hypothetical protein
MQQATTVQMLGAGAFGFLIGWFVYYINRHRSAPVWFADIAGLLGAVGGGAVLALFPAGTDLFGAYGIGLFLGYFGYFGYLGVLAVPAAMSENFGVDYFIDGRRMKPASGERLPNGPDRGAMGDPTEEGIRR